MKNLGIKNKEFLENLYWKQNLSFKQIAKKFGISDRTVRYWARKHCIESRPKQGGRKSKYRVGKNQLYDLYINKKLTLDQVARKLGIKHRSTVTEMMTKYGIMTRTISEVKTKHKRKPFSENLIEKSYILGLRTGDLSVYKNFHRIIVNVSTTHPSLVKTFQNIFGKYSHVYVYIHKDKRNIKELHAQCALNSSFDFLREKLIEIPKWILENDNYFFAFLAGYADAEGSFDIYENTDNTISFHFSVASNDKIILKQIFDKLKSKGFSTGFYLHSKKGQKATYGTFSKNIYAVRVFRKNDVLKLVKILKKYSKHDEKMKRMALILSLEKKTRWNEIQNRVLTLRKKIRKSRLQQSI